MTQKRLEVISHYCDLFCIISPNSVACRAHCTW